MSRPSKPRINNAWISDELTLRVGVPHFNGKLPAHCAEQDYPVMVSAGAFWRASKAAFVQPSRWPWSTDNCDVALDSAGFVAMRHWANRGAQRGMGGVYAWTLAEYLQLVVDVCPRWWSQPDACVEPEIARDAAAVEARCLLTIELLQDSLIAAALLSRRMDPVGFRPPVPVLQGWTPEQYRSALQRTLSTWDIFTAGTRFERQPTLIGVGSVCRRPLHGPNGLWRVLEAVARDLPAGVRLHLFGVKGEALQDLHHFPMVASVDSMAWDFRARAQAWENRESNSTAHRLEHMDRWVDRHLSRMDARSTPRGQLELLPTRTTTAAKKPLSTIGAAA